MDIVGGIAAASQALGIAKALRGIEKDYDAATYKAQIADLINALTDARIALADAKEVMADRDKEVERLKSNFAVKATLVKADGDYEFFADEDGNPVGYPTCPTCQPVRGLVVQLKQKGHSQSAWCPVCSNSFGPVECFLPKGSAYRTVAEKENAEYERLMSNLNSDRY